MNCVCQNGPQRPGLQEVLDTLQRSTVCTGTQCFETEAEAFGLQAPPSNAQDSSTAFVMLMMYAPPACAALSARATQSKGSDTLSSPSTNSAEYKTLQDIA